MERKSWSGKNEAKTIFSLWSSTLNIAYIYIWQHIYTVYIYSVLFYSYGLWSIRLLVIYLYIHLFYGQRLCIFYFLYLQRLILLIDTNISVVRNRVHCLRIITDRMKHDCTHLTTYTFQFKENGPLLVQYSFSSSEWTCNGPIFVNWNIFAVIFSWGKLKRWIL